MNDLEIKYLSADDIPLFLSYDGEPTPGVGAEHRDYQEFLAKREYRPEWTWVALRDGKVLARASFWGPPDHEQPFSLDWFQLGTSADRVDVGTALLKAAYDHYSVRPEYHLFVPANWRDSDVRQEIEDRVAAAEGAGLAISLERLGFRWFEGDPLPERTGRLTFRPADDAEMIEAVRLGLPGTLDGDSIANIKAHGDEAAAREIVEDLAGFPSPREWWRVAYTADGQLAGAVMPAKNRAIAVVGYITVAEGQRGKGYVSDMLIELMHFLIEQGEKAIGGDTDLPNEPMAKAFLRNGFHNHGGRLVLS
ncbi:GNAT family N-acetyltransferase [Catelliglobosispora koreensis]|uniref:GNAT family N-acetyltransferase n=1 Tax=Catelliglobosispora koreensis TaxID=129052 RepID=UPI00037CB79A|nr:GNAT family N-acetyltransferase [Catelliglobosispora koreensis]